MNQQNQNSNALNDDNKFCETSNSPPLTNPANYSFNNLDASQSEFKHNDLNRDISDPGKFLDLQRMLIGQGNAEMALKLSEYERALDERDNTIKSLRSDMMNSQNNNYILTNQCKSIMEKTKSVSDTCVLLNSSFTNICNRINKLGDTVDYVKTRQKDVTCVVDQTTAEFQDKILNISDKIDDSLKQVDIEKKRAKQELEILESKYSLDLNVCKSDLQECTKEINNIKSENYLLLEKLNETNIKLNEEKEMALSINQNYEKVLKEMDDQNVLLISQTKSLNIKYEEILNENQSLKDEINLMKNSLNENKNQLEMQLAVIKEQTELLDNLKITEELNNTLKKDNFSLKEQNEYLEKNIASLIEDISNIKLSQNEVQEEKENKFKDMCKNYDNLLRIQEKKVEEITEQLQVQHEKECKIQSEIIDLNQLVDMSKNTIFNLEEELKMNHTLIPELQRKIDDLSTNLAHANQKLQDLDQKNITEMIKLNKEKIDLENQSKDHFKQIEKLTNNYMKYKSKTKQLYVEVMKLRFQCSRSNQKNTPVPPSKLENIEILNDEFVNMADDNYSLVEFNNDDDLNMDVSIHSTSNKINQKYNISSFKRTSSPSRQISNSLVKKRKMSAENISSQILAITSKGPRQKTDIQQIENSSNSLYKSINLKNEDKNVNEIMEVNIEYNPDLKNKKSILTPLKEKNKVNNKCKNQFKFASDVGSKKKFKIPAELKQQMKKSKPTNIQNTDWPKPNSPVTLVPALSK